MLVDLYAVSVKKSLYGMFFHVLLLSSRTFVFGLRTTTKPHHNRLRPFFRGHPGEPVPEENFWSLWCKGRLTEADTPTIRLGATPSGLISAHLHAPSPRS